MVGAMANTIIPDRCRTAREPIKSPKRLPQGVYPHPLARHPGGGRRFPIMPWRVGNNYRPLSVAKPNSRRMIMNSIIYIVGLVVIVVAVLSFVGLA